MNVRKGINNRSDIVFPVPAYEKQGNVVLITSFNDSKIFLYQPFRYTSERLIDAYQTKLE